MRGDAITNKLCLSVEDMKSGLQSAPIKCFVCGPGQQHPLYRVRQGLVNALSGFRGVMATLGEELIGRRARRREAPTDLQTIESDFASRVDFTLLMVDTPGAIAELGAFAMIPQLRCRLYALLSGRFHGEASYIARGPLSVLAN